MTTRQPPSDDTTRTLPVVSDPDQTQIIPAVSSPPPDQSIRAQPAGADQTAIIPAVRLDDRDATAVIPAIRPRRLPRKDDTGFLKLGRVRAYDSEPGALGYQGRHSDIIPLAEASRARMAFHVVGELMITFGLVLLLFAGYEVWGKAAIVQSHQNDLDAALNQAWGADDPSVMAPPVDPSASPSPTAAPLPPPPGSSLGRLYLPRLGKSWVVVEGIRPFDIRYAPGHYPGTAPPGQIGNFSVAGHRSPAIFWDLDKMQTNDPVVVETRTTFYVYRVTAVRIVAPTAVEVVAPVPGHPGQAATVAMLTLTTCNPKWDNYQRLIVHAKLDHTVQRSEGRPIELGG